MEESILYLWCLTDTRDLSLNNKTRFPARSTPFRELSSGMELAGLFEKYAVDGVAVRFHQADRFREFAASRGIRIPQDLQLITGCTHYDWNPTMTEKPFAAIVSRLLRQLWSEMLHQESVLQDSSLQWNIKAGNSTR